MISTIRHFFEQHIKSEADRGNPVPVHSLRIATAALLIEMMRADSEITDNERKTVTDTIRSKFSLSREETESLLKLAKEEIWASTGYFEFTSLMNTWFSYDEKVNVIEQLWDVAYADAILDSHEEYMVRKIANLIHVEHRDFIDAKLRARARAESIREH
jgi:uncharacterized tellurite resistance protein B-like protein